ncbi:distal tail protein Dit [Geobacillus zalihae]|uniref:distal tail protein Dit n=1 Tax=Geobacillus zalihae TaxID=213419 RepID=UPI0016810499|nr:distal tail protein Dit [Geobacillus zalihae]QNU26372.1 hypothetical protein IC806_08065 [Geobacillus zalihae]
MPVPVQPPEPVHRASGLSLFELKRFLAGKLNKGEPKPLIFEDESDKFHNC